MALRALFVRASASPACGQPRQRGGRGRAGSGPGPRTAVWRSRPPRPAADRIAAAHPDPGLLRASRRRAAHRRADLGSPRGVRRAARVRGDPARRQCVLRRHHAQPGNAWAPATGTTPDVDRPLSVAVLEARRDGRHDRRGRHLGKRPDGVYSPNGKANNFTAASRERRDRHAEPRCQLPRLQRVHLHEQHHDERRTGAADRDRVVQDDLDHGREDARFRAAPHRCGAAGSGGTYDRHIYMDGNGKIGSASTTAGLPHGLAGAATTTASGTWPSARSAPAA